MLTQSLRWLLKAPLHATSGPTWHCPICDRDGRFVPFNGREYARCWRCGSLERHRLIWHALHHSLDIKPSWRALHVAPENCLRRHFEKIFAEYITGDLERTDVMLSGLDICRMPFIDGEFDIVIASHVLEHVEHDRVAIREIHRVLKPGGVAVLPVPWGSGRTIEFGSPKADEMHHWRRPGLDYLDRYQELFVVDVVTSNDAPAEWQPAIHHSKPSPEWLGYDVLPLCRKPG